jgi:hypothetical protein
MARYRTLAVLFLALAIAVPSQASHDSNCAEACWEKCFQTDGTENERYKEVYDNLLEIILEINLLTKIYNVTKLGFLYDTAMSSRHGINENPATGNLENGHNTFHVYFMLMQAILLAVNGQKNYIVQYNEESAWACNEMQCLDNTNCAVTEAVKYMVPIELLPTSHCPGAIEAACKLMHDQMTDVPCSSGNDNRMVVAISNGDININNPYRHVKHHESSSEESICPPFRWAHFNGDSSSSSGSDERDFFSPCHSYFDTRYAIGTHTAKREVMELFTSKHGNHRYFHDEEFTLNALDNLVWCMTRTTACCASTPTAPTLTTCFKTQGPFGEITNPFSTHPGITATAPIIDFPVDPASGAIMNNVG